MSPKKRQHGPKRTKQQITIRLNKELMDEAYVQMKEDRTRVTDMVERGLVLALRERGHFLPFTKNTPVRFILADIPPEYQTLIRGLAIAMVEEQVLEEQGETLPPLDRKLFELIEWWLMEANKLPDDVINACLREYEQYAKKKGGK